MAESQSEPATAFIRKASWIRVQTIRILASGKDLVLHPRASGVPDEAVRAVPYRRGICKVMPRQTAVPSALGSGSAE